MKTWEEAFVSDVLAMVPERVFAYPGKSLSGVAGSVPDVFNETRSSVSILRQRVTLKKFMDAVENLRLPLISIKIIDGKPVEVKEGDDEDDDAKEGDEVDGEKIRELTEDEIDYAYFSRIDALTSYRASWCLRVVVRDINRANKMFGDMVARYRLAENNRERELICIGAIEEIKNCLESGGRNPYTYFFLRRFGLYA